MIIKIWFWPCIELHLDNVLEVLLVVGVELVAWTKLLYKYQMARDLTFQTLEKKWKNRVIEVWAKKKS